MKSDKTYEDSLGIFRRPSLEDVSVVEISASETDIPFVSASNTLARLNNKLPQVVSFPCLDAMGHAQKHPQEAASVEQENKTTTATNSDGCPQKRPNDCQQDTVSELSSDNIPFTGARTLCNHLHYQKTAHIKPSSICPSAVYDSGNSSMQTELANNSFQTKHEERYNTSKCLTTATYNKCEAETCYNQLNPVCAGLATMALTSSSDRQQDVTPISFDLSDCNAESVSPPQTALATVQDTNGNWLVSEMSHRQTSTNSTGKKEDHLDKVGSEAATTSSPSSATPACSRPRRMRKHSSACVSCMCEAYGKTEHSHKRSTKHVRSILGPLTVFGDPQKSAHGRAKATASDSQRARERHRDIFCSPSKNGCHRRINPYVCAASAQINMSRASTRDRDRPFPSINGNIKTVDVDFNLTDKNNGDNHMATGDNVSATMKREDDQKCGKHGDSNASDKHADGANTKPKQTGTVKDSVENGTEPPTVNLMEERNSSPSLCCEKKQAYPRKLLKRNKAQAARNYPMDFLKQLLEAEMDSAEKGVCGESSATSPADTALPDIASNTPTKQQPDK